MVLLHFAHAGVEHADEAEAAAHAAGSNNLPAILAVSIIVGAVVFVLLKLLTGNKAKETDK